MKIFKSEKDIPKFHKKGFKKKKVPESAWKLILNLYQKVKEKEEEEEHFDFKEVYIPHESGKVSSNILNIGEFETHKQILFQMLQEDHEKFCSNAKIKPCMMYGIRSYLNGAKLAMHVDKVETHHISSIIMVDKDLGGKKDWPLNIIDHKGKPHEVYLEPGEMVLYESATCEHGREEIFKGNYFRNFFVHYSLADYKYEP